MPTLAQSEYFPHSLIMEQIFVNFCRYFDPDMGKFLILLLLLLMSQLENCKHLNKATSSPQE